jgi:glycosyltransferase involved in cell wall biosynthesis
MKIGIFLYLPPSNSNNFLLSGGLPRNAITTAVALQRFLVHEIIIVVPKGYKETVKELVYEMSQNEQRLPSVVCPKSKTLYSWLNKLARKPQLTHNRKKAVRQSNQNRLTRKFVASLFTYSPSYTILLVSFSLILVPTFLLWLALMNPQEAAFLAGMICILFITVKSVKWTFHHISIFTKVKSRITRIKASCNNLLKKDIAAIIIGKYSRLVNIFSGEILYSDVKNLTSFGNTLSIDIWWNPSTLFQAASNLRSPVVSTFADFLPLEFPTMFLKNKEFYRLLESSKIVCQSSARIVCLSTHVKENHLQIIDPGLLSKTVVINPGPPTKKFEKVGVVNSSSSQRPAFESLKEDFANSKAASREWWLNPVIVAATQNRGAYKNLENLILAIRNLNLSGIPTHLLLTCRDDENQISNFIKQNSCENVVQILPDLSENQMSAVFASCTLAISASHFEASIPFTLYESVSQGKPCLLADIPVTREAMSQFPIVHSATLFDPSNHRSISDKVSWAISNQKRLFTLQHEFLIERERCFGWPATSKKFNSIFEEVIEEGNVKQKK